MYDMQLLSPLQLARVEGQKASLESELRAANEDLELLPARLEEAMAAADTARAEARASADKVGSPGPMMTNCASVLQLHFCSARVGVCGMQDKVTRPYV